MHINHVNLNIELQCNTSFCSTCLYCQNFLLKGKFVLDLKIQGSIELSDTKMTRERVRFGLRP